MYKLLSFFFSDLIINNLLQYPYHLFFSQEKKNKNVFLRVLFYKKIVDEAKSIPIYWLVNRIPFSCISILFTRNISFPYVNHNKWYFIHSRVLHILWSVCSNLCSLEKIFVRRFGFYRFIDDKIGKDQLAIQFVFSSQNKRAELYDQAMNT